MHRTSILLLLISLLFFASCAGSHSVEMEGAMQRWHPVTLTFEGPQTSEEGTLNPFRDYRLSVVFTHTASPT